MKEAQLQSAVIELAIALGFLVAHFRPAQVRPGVWATAMSGHTGYPDLSMAGNGRIVFAELKTMKGRLSVEQEGWRDALVLAGAEYHVWRPSDWTSGQVERVLRQPGHDALVGRIVRTA